MFSLAEEDSWSAPRAFLRIRAREFGTQDELSIASGLPKTTIQKILNGTGEPGITRVERLAAVLGVSMDYLADLRGGRDRDPTRDAISHMITGIGGALAPPASQRRGADDAAFPVLAPNLAATVPIRILNVIVSAGDGAINHDQIRERTIDFPAIFLRGETDTGHLSLLRVSGDSMEPDLRAGDWVLVDDRRREDSGIHVIRRDDQLTVKRIQRQGGIMRLISANMLYAAEEIDLAKEGDAFEVTGKVIWGGRWF